MIFSSTRQSAAPTSTPAVITNDVSRVHAVLLAQDGEVMLIDAASTNGTFTGDREVKCEAVEPRRSYSLGKMHVIWEPSHQRSG